MCNGTLSRRNFLADAAIMSCGTAPASACQAAAAGPAQAKLHIACNQYPWSMFYRRE